MRQPVPSQNKEESKNVNAFHSNGAEISAYQTHHHVQVALGNGEFPCVGTLVFGSFGSGIIKVFD